MNTIVLVIFLIFSVNSNAEINEFYDFNDNNIPLGWTSSKSWPFGSNAGITSGYLYAYNTSGIAITRSYTPANNITELDIWWDAYYSPAHNGVQTQLDLGNNFIFRLTAAEYNFGDSFESRITSDGPANIQLLPLSHGNYTLNANITDQQLTFTGYRGGAQQFAMNLPYLNSFDSFNQIRFSAYKWEGDPVRVDNIRITETTLSAPVPEPETYAMFLAGLGLLGFASRKNKA